MVSFKWVSKKGPRMSVSTMLKKSKMYIMHMSKTFVTPHIFTALKFTGSHSKPHSVWGLIKNYHICLDPKLGHDTCYILHIPVLVWHVLLFWKKLGHIL